MKRDFQKMNSEHSKEKSDFQNGLVLRLRTKDDLRELLQSGASGSWKVAQGREKQISKVQIFNWDGSMMLEASHDTSNSVRRSEDNRLIVALNSKDAKIVKCDPPFKWVVKNPVSYVKENSVTPQLNSVEHETIENATESVATQAETVKEPVPHAPDGFTHVSPQVAELCELADGVA